MYLVKKILSTPLIWIGLTLTIFTIHYEGLNNALSIFLTPTTYKNLCIGSIIYVAIFDKRYTKGHTKLDLKETFNAILETIATILVVWLISTSLYVGYHQGGEMYSIALQKKLTELKNK